MKEWTRTWAGRIAVATAVAVTGSVGAVAAAPATDGPEGRPHTTGISTVSAVDHRTAVPHHRPVPGGVIRAADIPEHDWLPGHRGVDLAASPGDVVVSSSDGTVHFAGVVAGTPVVSVTHGDGVRTTYEPVIAGVSAGDPVRRGQAVGVLADAAKLPDSARRDAGLSWGARTGPDHERYIDPMSLLAPVRVRLWG
ncbi:M23 family metallopeptidase [Corynebacterium sp.]|uniref:M23 family metallopeptidase n=1 Tax=Corynebacterium sp. TaxID=1720 RepID=UPI0025C2882E|nr:M23 family metallopeptidase [Corynebacterium sp.]